MDELGVHDPSSRTREELETEYNEICQDIQDIQARLLSRKTDNSFQGVLEDQFSLSQIMQVKELKLKGEIAVLKEKEISVPTDSALLEVLLEEELSKNTQQLEETLQVVKAQRKEVTEDLDREKEFLNEHTEVQSSLQNKIDQQIQDKENMNSSFNQLRELTRKHKKVNSTCLQLMRSLAEFMSEHFPSPNAENIKEVKKDFRQSLDPDSRFLSLQEIIEILMNRLYENPHDPYMELKPFHWVPYIELLLRSGIAQRHPTDCNLVRMVAFNR